MDDPTQDPNKRDLYEDQVPPVAPGDDSQPGEVGGVAHGVVADAATVVPVSVEPVAAPEVPVVPVSADPVVAPEVPVVPVSADPVVVAPEVPAE